MKTVQESARLLKQILKLNSLPVGVKFYFTGMEIPNVQRLDHHRYCQALMKARRGEHILLDAQGISCPAAAAAFGFKPLTTGLQTGKSLQGSGIVQDANTGKRMFEEMTRLEPGELHALYLFPLQDAVIAPDIVVIEDEIEKLMWIALAEINKQGGSRLESSTAVLLATCVDATIIPFMKKKFNMSFGCYGCRDATDIGGNETVLGFPFEEFNSLFQILVFLQEKAIPDSRSKNAFKMLSK